MPRVSVLLPCREAADTLLDAIASLDRQTYTDFEVIAVDDASTDQTGALLERWSEREKRVRVVHTTALGLVPALETARAEATGELLARMDADDIAHHRRLQRQVALLDERSELAVCGTKIRYFPREAVRDGARRYERWINRLVSVEEIEREIFVECPVPHPTLMLRRAALEDVGGWRDPGWPEDYDLVLRLWEAGYRLGKVDDVLLKWRESSERLSRTDPRYSEDSFRRCKVHYIGRRIADRSVVIVGSGPLGKAFARSLKDAGHSITAFVDVDPNKIGQEIHGALVVPPDRINDYQGSYALAAVGSDHSRAEIRSMLSEAGWREPEDWCAVA